MPLPSKVFFHHAGVKLDKTCQFVNNISRTFMLHEFYKRFRYWPLCARNLLRFDIRIDYNFLEKITLCLFSFVLNSSSLYLVSLVRIRMRSYLLSVVIQIKLCIQHRYSQPLVKKFFASDIVRENFFKSYYWTGVWLRGKMFGVPEQVVPFPL